MQNAGDHSSEDIRRCSQHVFVGSSPIGGLSHGMCRA